jgi:hypothetical protein
MIPVGSERQQTHETRREDAVVNSPFATGGSIRQQRCYV